LSVVYLVLPLAVIVAAVAAFVFVRAARSGQFDDLDTPSVRMLHDDDPVGKPGGDGSPGPLGARPGDRPAER